MTTIIFDLKCLWRARKDFDVVYMLGYGAGIFCFIPRLWGSTVWINMDGVEWARSKWSPLAKSYFRMMELLSMWTPNRVIADAAAIEQHLKERHWHVPPCNVIPYGAEVLAEAPPAALLSEWGLQSDGYYIVVCRLEPENHVREIVEGYAASDSPYPLVILGNHKSGTAYVDQLLRIDDERIRFIGTVYDQQKLRALRYHARAYFHGHSVGGTNPSLLEAMGCDNAVIAHDNPFNREVASDAAVYFSCAKDIPHLLKRLDETPALVEEMRERARSRIASQYTWEAITDMYQDLLCACRVEQSEGSNRAALKD